MNMSLDNNYKPLLDAEFRLTFAKYAVLVQGADVDVLG
jgi:hypothetical protein